MCATKIQTESNYKSYTLSLLKITKTIYNFIFCHMSCCAINSVKATEEYFFYKIKDTISNKKLNCCCESQSYCMQKYDQLKKLITA